MKQIVLLFTLAASVRVAIPAQAQAVPRGIRAAARSSSAACPNYAKTFLNVMTPIAGELATAWYTDADYILAFSALRSNWLESQSQRLHNPFGLTGADGKLLDFSSFQAAAQYWSANSGQFVADDESIEAFASDLLPSYSAASPETVQLLIRTYHSVVTFKRACGR